MVSDARAPAPAGEGVSSRSERVGWYLYDWANSAFPTTVITVFLGPYLGSIAENAADANGLVHPLGIPVAAGSLVPYTLSLSVVLQVLALPVVGAIADRSPRKKQLLGLLAYVGAAATTALIFLTGERYLLGAGLLVVANVAYGASIVVYNSFLPQVAGPDERDSVSSIGWGIGYIGGGLLLAINVAAVLSKDVLGMDTAEVARWSLVSAGVWWAAFTTLPLLLLRNRPPAAGQARGWVLLDGFRQLWATLRSLRAYPLTLFFLIAFLCYNDGIQTVIALVGVYATSELGLPDTVLVPTILMVQAVAFVGAVALGRLARRVGARRTVLFGLLLWTVTLGVAYFLPRAAVLPFVSLAAVIGFVLGGTQALSRSLFSQLIPRGREGEYFGIYEISDRGTSWLGTLLFGLTYQATGSYRAAIISLLPFFVVGIAALAAVPMRRAILAAGNNPPRVL